MKLPKLPFPLNKNTISLLGVGLIAITFFVAGLLNILDYPIFKIVVFGGVIILAIALSVILFKNSSIKNRPEDNLQDD